jgi:hypothetical protein
MCIRPNKKTYSRAIQHFPTSPLRMRNCLQPEDSFRSGADPRSDASSSLKSQDWTELENRGGAWANECESVENWG